MGEEKGNNNNATEEKKEEEQIIVLKVDMHCDACAKKILCRILVNNRTSGQLNKLLVDVVVSEGVEDVAVDRKSSTIAVKGEIEEPSKLSDGIRAKTGRNAILISPLPKPPSVQDQQPKDDNNTKDNQSKDQPPPVVTVVLRVQMHCEACAQLLRKRINKIKGVEGVETNVGNGQVRVKGIIPNPEELAEYVYKKTGKQVWIVKEEEKKDKEESKGVVVEEDNNNNNVGSDDQVMKRYEYYWPNTSASSSSRPYSSGYLEHPSNYNYYHHHHHHHHHPHQSQFFSDENPNACSLMEISTRTLHSHFDHIILAIA